MVLPLTHIWRQAFDVPGHGLAGIAFERRRRQWLESVTAFARDRRQTTDAGEP